VDHFLRTRTRLAAAAGAGALSLLSLPLLAAPASAVAAPPAASTTAADLGAAYLASQINGSGFVPGTGGTADLGSTVQAVLAFHAVGAGGPKAAAAEAYVAANAATYLGGGTPTTDDPARLARLIMVAVTTGANPASYGTGSIDLVARLLATQNQYTADGPVDAGLFGAADPTFDGAYRQGLALAALTAAGVTNPAGSGWLTSQQCADGGWMSYRADTSVACTPADPNTFSGEDTNSTALAIEGLVAQGVSIPVSPLTVLHGLQSTDGGFGFFGGTSDPDSTAVVLQALLAFGEDPASVSWSAGSANPYTALVGFQLGCATATPGAFFFGTASSGANMFATLDAVPAVAGKPFPLAASTSAAAPAVGCAAIQQPASPSPTPTPTPTSTTAALPVAATADPTLPSTGSSATGMLVLFGAAFLVTGAAALVVARGSRRAHRG